MNGVEIIYAERVRQIEKEGWTPEHDAEHDQGELLRAATSYLDCAYGQEMGRPFPSKPPMGWPFESKWWKPSDDPKRNLEKAGAFIAAEIDRLVRDKTGEDPIYLPAGPETLSEMEAWCTDMIKKIAEARAGKFTTLGDILRAP